MSEPESIATRASHGVVSRGDAEDILPDIAARAVPEREGLPRSYRMRADAHYVDQLEAPAQPVIRMIKTGQIDCRDLPAPDRVDALTTSIAMHGVLQPLLVCRQGGRYSLIAGRKRLAAAIAAGAAAVPCVVHDAEGAAAVALAAADNLRIDEAPSRGTAERDAVRPLLETLAADLATIASSISLLRIARTGGLSQKVGADLIEAQAVRASWLVNATLGNFDGTRLAPLAAIVQRVSDGFEAQSSLSGLQLECSVAPAAAVWKLPEAPVAAAISGAVFASVAMLDGIARPRIEVHADAPQARTLRVEIVQRAVRVPAGSPSEQDSGRSPEIVTALALRLARSVAAPLGGSAELTPLPGAGSVLQITFAGGHIAG